LANVTFPQLSSTQLTPTAALKELEYLENEKKKTEKYSPKYTLVPEVFFFSLGATELSGEAAKTSREAASKKNLWYQRITTSLPCRLQFRLIDIRCQSLF